MAENLIDNIANKNNQPKTDYYTNFIGDLKRAFGSDQLALTIETVNADGSVSGFDVLMGNRRG